VSGRLGALMLEHANEVLKGGYLLEHSIYGSTLPLVGCARHAPHETKSMLVFDFGQTAVKRGVSGYENGVLIRLDTFPSLPSPNPQGAGAELLRQMVEIVKTTRTLSGIDSPHIVLSVASYITDGQPAEDAFYGRLRECGNATHVLSDALSAGVKLLHDGTAAAHTYAGLKNTAVITIGTALGVGFTPPLENLREKNLL
jgi:hypothetical protein